MITWYLEEKEADYIMNVLAQRPFAEVAGLIDKMVKQANPPRTAQAEMEQSLQESNERLAKVREAKLEQMRSMQNAAFQDMDEHTQRIGDDLVRNVMPDGKDG